MHDIGTHVWQRILTSFIYCMQVVCMGVWEEEDKEEFVNSEVALK
jgi:hypothetical protein